MDSEVLGNNHHNNGHDNEIIVCETANGGDSFVAEDQLTHFADELTGVQRSLSH